MNAFQCSECLLRLGMSPPAKRDSTLRTDCRDKITMLIDPGWAAACKVPCCQDKYHNDGTVKTTPGRFDMILVKTTVSKVTATSGR